MSATAPTCGNSENASHSCTLNMREIKIAQLKIAAIMYFGPECYVLVVGLYFLIQIQSWFRFNPHDNFLLRTIPAVQDTLGTIAPNVLGMWITGAPTTVNARMGCLAVGSVSVMRASTERPARCVNLGDMEKTASLVTSTSNLYILQSFGRHSVEALFNKLLVFIWQNATVNMANVWTIWREMGSAFVSKVGREGIALLVSIKVKLILCQIACFLPSCTWRQFFSISAVVNDACGGVCDVNAKYGKHKYKTDF